MFSVLIILFSSTGGYQPVCTHSQTLAKSFWASTANPLATLQFPLIYVTRSLSFILSLSNHSSFPIILLFITILEIIYWPLLLIDLLIYLPIYHLPYSRKIFTKSSHFHSYNHQNSKCDQKMVVIPVNTAFGKLRQENCQEADWGKPGLHKTLSLKKHKKKQTNTKSQMWQTMSHLTSWVYLQSSLLSSRLYGFG